jgi:hypothetical protein
MAYTPPESPEFIFTETGYSVPADGLDIDFLFELPASPTSFYILAGTSLNFVAIWAEPDASLTNGRFQVSSTGTGAGLSVIDLATHTLYDYYTTTVSGRAGEALESDNIIDLVTV